MNIIPIEGTLESVIQTIPERLKDVFPNVIDEVEYRPEIEMPSKAYNPSRDQYRAQIILHHIAKKFGSKEGKILVITSEDLYSQRLNFIFGQAQKPGKIAIISLHRLKPEFWGKKKDRDLFLARAVKECVHELGHTFGLDHCEDQKCVMSFSNRIEHTDRKKARFCEKCEENMKSFLRVRE
ncbi:MAG: archaemetzincin family Zn-dependent metalloprotease [Candidatus Thermoplasmatota archaeon]|nr:archaemetzincin family Zn-dependent metalloprotease [Candidatus Thermoplasmatota archaeon]MBS3789664.1 archaemetzincin family Zn-dependent metalloprotease [Candidatus Thermoplasmatota archaeon]